LANAIAAIKAHRRGWDDQAAKLLTLAEERVGVESPAGALHVRRRILLLTAAMAEMDPTTASLAAEVRNLVVEMF